MLWLMRGRGSQERTRFMEKVKMRLGGQAKTVGFRRRLPLQMYHYLGFSQLSTTAGKQYPCHPQQ